MRELIASYYTLAGNIHPFEGSQVSPHDLVERARAAVRAGYRGLGFGMADLHALEERHGFREISHILDGEGIVHREIEVLFGWFAEGEPRARSDAERRWMLEAATGIGARHIKVAGDLSGSAWPMDHLIEAFAGLCDEAREAGTAITIELMPTTNLADLQSGRAVVEGAAQPNGGLLLDIWHVMRGRLSLAAIAGLPAGMVNHVELNDGTLSVEGEFFHETLNKRRFPGEGEFPLREFLRALDACDYRGLVGVELFSPDVRDLPLDVVAGRSTTGIKALSTWHVTT
jgi:sugar phosphate isomerase/epimerase